MKGCQWQVQATQQKIHICRAIPDFESKESTLIVFVRLVRFFGYRSGKKAPCESVWSPLASRRFAPVFGVTRKDSSPDFGVFCRNESKNLRLGIKSWILRKKCILSVLLGQKIFTFVEELTQYWHVLESTENHDNEGKKRSRPAEKLNRGTQQLKGNFQFIFFHLFHYRIY